MMVKEEKLTASSDNKSDFFLKDITEAIGDIPLIRLRRMTAVRGIKATVLVKPEFLNPSGSIKDRMAVYILNQAIARGDLKPGGTIVEATSGNTGAAVAMFAAANDFKAIFTIPDKMSKEKTKQSKELIAQGIGNGLVAFIGGIPGAQATIRSVLILKENATLRIAGVMVGIFVFLEIALFKDYINFIPQAVFAGVLFKVGYDVFDFIPFKLYAKELKKFKWHLFQDFFADHTQEKVFISNREMILIIGTVVVTLTVNLNAAVIAFTAIFYLANKVFWKSNPIRDLTPFVETEAMVGKDIIDDNSKD